MVDVAQLVEPRIVIPAVAGSSPVVHPTSGLPGGLLMTRFIGPLAQLVEQLTLNQLVVGSIPTRPTIYPRPQTSGNVRHDINVKDPYKSRVLSSRDVLKISLTDTPWWGHFCTHAGMFLCPLAA
jgi:hypothetical protein